MIDQITKYRKDELNLEDIESEKEKFQYFDLMNKEHIKERLIIVNHRQ
ncbi:hypothetical protein [Tepidibacter sp. Z1-5]